MIREKQIRSGRLLEVDFYPVSSDGKQLPRGEKKRSSTEEMKKYNKLVATKKVVRLVNANFDNDDIFLHLTYSPDKQPSDEKQARRDIVNYLRRIKTYRASEAKRIKALLKSYPQNKKLISQLKKVNLPLKYLYVIEKTVYKSGKRQGKTNFHFHLFISGSGNGDRDRYEELWNSTADAKRFRPDKFGPDAAAKYICKDPQGSKRYVCSRSLEKPVESVKDGRITQRKVELMGTKHIDDAGYWERRYKGYSFLKCYSRYNDYNGCWYVSAVMYRYGDGLPPWNAENWMT